MQFNKQQLEPDIGQQTGSILGKEYVKTVYYFYAEYIMWNASLDEAQAWIKVPGKNINNLRYADDTTLMAESEEELKNLFMKVKEESEKVGLKLNIQKAKTMASRWGNSWGNNENSDRLYFLGLQNHCRWWCSHEIKRHLLLGRKVITNLDSILKSRDDILPTKVHLVKAMVFPVVKYRCESWTIKKAECRRIDAFELWYWRRLLRVPWTARRSSQSILKEIGPEYLLEELMLKLKLQYLATWCNKPTHLKRPRCSERLKAGGEEDDRGWDGWMAPLTWRTWVWASSGGWLWTGKPGVLQSMRSQSIGHNWATELITHIYARCSLHSTYYSSCFLFCFSPRSSYLEAEVFPRPNAHLYPCTY